MKLNLHIVIGAFGIFFASVPYASKAAEIVNMGHLMYLCNSNNETANSLCVGYIRGMIEGVQANSAGTKVLCVPETSTAQGVVAAINSRVAGNKDFYSLPSGPTMYLLLKDIFRCR
jgi:hypothetical protein